MPTVCAIILLCLMAESLSAPLTCEDLVRPLAQVDPHHLEGQWAMIAGSLSHLPFIELFKQRDSVTINFYNSSDTDTISYSRSIRLEGKCHSTHYNMSLEGSSYTFENDNITATFTYTSCPDCILLSFDVESGKRLHFYLFSKRRQLEQEELEEFRAQTECLKLPPPVVLDPNKELCPKQDDVSLAAVPTEEKNQ